jgi:V/A-type H+-transporting ATPase subunit I
LTVQKLIRVIVVGRRDYYAFAEDALSHLKCMDVTGVERLQWSFVIDGWIPQVWLPDLEYILEEGSRGKVAVEWDETVSPAVTATPVLLENPRLIKPFEYLVQLFSLPGRAGYDPTFLTFLTLPLFFGFVIGDFGYGISFVTAGLLIRRWFRTPMAELASLFMVFGGLWSIVFGTVLFADFFGFRVEVGPLAYHLLDKLEDATQLLLISLAIGLVHINLGIAIGFIYERRRAGLKLAVLRKISWYILETGLILLAVGVLGYFAAPLWIPGLAIIAFAAALLALGGGLVEVVEIPTFISNILSYLRLGALGLAKGALSVTIDIMVVQNLFPLGPIGVVLGVVVLAIGHALVMALALITVTISALRLHYLEFYTKFYPLEEIGVPRSFEPTVELPKPREG